jgi:flavin-dependent dehydrogenase
MAHQLKGKDDTIQRHWRLLVNRLMTEGLVDEPPGAPRGYSYYLRGQKNTSCAGNLHLIGDARGLATRDLCEGIGPAVRSGLQAAQAIAGHKTPALIDCSAFSLTQKLPQRALEWQFLRTHLAA